jgi:hypothetical protein
MTKAVTQATAVMPTTCNNKHDSHSSSACNSRHTNNTRNESNIRNESNNRIANTVWTPSKAGMLAKTVKPATALRRPTTTDTIGTSQPQQQKGDPQQQGYQK